MRQKKHRDDTRLVDPFIQPSTYSIDEPRPTGLLLRLDRQGTYLEVVPAADTPPSASPSDVIGRNLSDVWPKEIAQRLQQAIEQTLASREQQELCLCFTLRGRAARYAVRVSAAGTDHVTFAVTDTTAADERLERLQASEVELKNHSDRQATAIQEARQALESAAVHLPLNSEADVLAAKALATILSLVKPQQ